MSVSYVYFSFDNNSLFMFYKNDEKYTLSKLCLQGTIKLSRCKSVELCNTCAATPRACINIINDGTKIDKCHIREPCTDGCDLTISQKITGMISYALHTRLKPFGDTILDAIKKNQHITVETAMFQHIKELKYITNICSVITFIPMIQILDVNISNIDPYFKSSSQIDIISIVTTMLSKRDLISDIINANTKERMSKGIQKKGVLFNEVIPRNVVPSNTMDWSINSNINVYM